MNVNTRFIIGVCAAYIGGFACGIGLSEYVMRKDEEDRRYFEKNEDSKEVYENIARRFIPDEEEIEVETYRNIMAESEHLIEEDVVAGAPYFITVDQFTDENLGYEKLTYTYFIEDDTLVDEEESPVHVKDTIGQETVNFVLDKHILNEENRVLTRYVRNEKISVDYEVMFVYSSYACDCLGIGGTDD